MHNNRAHTPFGGRVLLKRAPLVISALLVLLTLGVPCCSRPPIQGGSWQSLDGPRATFVTALAKHPNEPSTLYAAVLGGGVFTSTDGGEAWDYLGGAPGPREVVLLAEPDLALLVDCIDVSSEGRVFAGTQGAGVYSYSPEIRWTPLTSGLRKPNVHAIALGGASEEHLLAGTTNGLFRLEAPFVSSTAWVSPTVMEGQKCPEHIQCLFTSAEFYPRLYAGAEEGFWFSDDGGDTWPQADEGLDPDVNVIAMAVDPRNQAHVVLSAWNRRVYETMDGGETWRPSLMEFDSVIEELVFSTVTPGMLYAVTHGGTLYASVREADGQLGWRSEGEIDRPVLSLLALRLDGDSERLVAGTDGEGIWFRKQDGTWAQASIPSRPLLTVMSILSSRDHLLVGTDCCGIFRRTSDGQWQAASEGLPLQARRVSAIVKDKAGTMYAGTNDGVYARAADAVEWQRMSTGLAAGGLAVESLVAFESEAEQVLLAGTEAGLYKREGSGVWERVAADVLPGTVANLQWEPLTRSLFATASDGSKLCVSRDRGKSWLPDDYEWSSWIEQLALTSSPTWRGYVLRSPRWTLFARTADDAIYMRTPGSAWQPLPTPISSQDQPKIWGCPNCPDSLLLAKATLEGAGRSRTLRSQGLLTMPRLGLDSDIPMLDASIEVLTVDSGDKSLLYAGTGNQGVYSTRLAMPSLWQQLSAARPMRELILAAVAIVVVVVLACVVYRQIRRVRVLELAVGAAHHDFRLLVTSDQAIEAASGEGEVRGTLQLDLQALGPTLQRIEQDAGDAELLKSLGTALYQALFPAEIHTHLWRTVTAAEAEQNDVHLRLVLRQAELAALPWEFLYDQRTNTFLANDPRTALSRYVELPLRRREIRPASLPLRILVVVSAPSSLPQLDADGEEQLIRAALRGQQASGRVEIEVLHEATVSNIMQRLQTKPYNVFHFIGHGVFERDAGSVALPSGSQRHLRPGVKAAEGKGSIALLGNNGQEHLVDEERFANLFLGNRSLGLIVLNACQGATVSSHQALAGIAPRLVQRGIPAVVAMQYPILDDTAKIFADRFYQALAEGRPVDTAMQITRNAISIEVGLDRRDFGTPVLYMRARNGVIFAGR